MTLDEIERKAASILTEQWHGQDTIELAEMLLLVMPVVHAAERWRLGMVDAPPIRIDEQDLLRAIDTMRRGLEEEP